MSESDAFAERRSLRRQMRERRNGLDPAQVRRASEQLRNRLLSLPRFRHARNLAAYLAVQNEMPLHPVIDAAWSLQIPVYLPCLRGARMEFHRYTPETRLRANRFGIPEPEPAPGSRISARFLDIVLAPLVAFDADGGRLGTGGGFYDRTFAFLHHRRHWNRPELIGAAYEFQRTAAIPCASWDVPLRAVATEAAIHDFRQSKGETACITG